MTSALSLLLIIAAALLLLVLAIAYLCFRMAFYSPDSDRPAPDEVRLPDGSIYVPYHEAMTRWIWEMRAMPHEDVSITSFDGLTLRGKFFEYAPDAPIELMIHGWRGTAERDLCGGVQRCFSMGRSVLLIDQRAAGSSEGNVISFGINEHRDCLAWVDFLCDRFGDRPIILTGSSMGAATVMIAAGEPLPSNVVGVIADCGFTSARDIIRKVIGDMKLPPALGYPFAKLGAYLFGGFRLEEKSAVEAMRRCRIPVFFIHGTDDRFVPYEMSVACYEACAAPKYLFTVPDAGHGLGYLKDQEGYVRELVRFSQANGIPIDPNSTTIS